MSISARVSLNIWSIGTRAVDAGTLVEQACRFDTQTNNLEFCAMSGVKTSVALSGKSAIKVVGAGKAAGKMAIGLEQALREHEGLFTLTGQVNVPEDRVVATEHISVIGCRPPGYNFPTDRVLAESQTIANTVQALAPQDVCIALICGGGSALLELPKVPLEDLVKVSKQLSQQGASIEELNTVRRCLSQVKAGGLTHMMPVDHLSGMTALIISDVISDDLGMVSSGPTVISTTSPEADCVNAMRVMNKYFPNGGAPNSVTVCLAQEPTIRRATATANQVLIGNHQVAVDAAKSAAVSLGYQPPENVSPTFDVNTDVTLVANQFLDLLLKNQNTAKPWCLVTGGEPTVMLCDTPGTGGRNLQLAATLLALIVQHGNVGREFEFVSGGTDGEDGTALAAGGWFDQTLVKMLIDDGDELEFLNQCIATNDCDTFFRKHDRLVLLDKAIQTNVCDLHVLLAR